MTVAIIEDFYPDANTLSKTLKSLNPNIHIACTLVSVSQSVKWLSENKPDLIFSDIELSDGYSFEIFRKLKTPTPIIFCTAFDQYMLEAFDTYAISYIIKPLNKDKLQKVLLKYDHFKDVFNNKKLNDAVEGLINQLTYSYPQTIFVTKFGKLTPVETNKIAYAYLENNVLKLVTISGEVYHTFETLEQFYKKLNPTIFFRANRRYIINRTAVKNVERFLARKLIANLVIKTMEPVVISKAKSTLFLNWFKLKS